MKNLKYILFIFALSVVSCEEVIDLDLNTVEPKLVIEATVNVREDKVVDAFVILSETFSYFNNQQPFVDNAEVRIISENNEIYFFEYIENGRYESEFIPIENIEYTLEILYKNELYTATNKLVSAPSYNGQVQQSTIENFGEASIELKALFNDPVDEDNFYFYIGSSIYGKIYDSFDDTFFNGNEFFTSYTSSELKPGDIVTFNLYGITEANYSYFFKLLLQSDNTTFGPFSTQPATVRGNIVNQTNPDNFPLGYFRISEVSSLVYTVQ